MKRKYPGFGAVRRAACLLPAVLACAFAGAGQAQTLYTQGLDYAVRELTRELVDGAGLRDLRDRDKRVLVESEDFFELGTGLRLGLSDKLRGLSSSHLTAYGVDVALSGSDADAVRVLHGRWQRESETELYLELFVAEPVKSGDPTALRSAKGRVPIDEGIQALIESTPDDWGRLLVRKLERGVRDQRERTVRLQSMALGGDEGQGDELKGFLEGWLGSALVGSRLFTLVEPPPGVAVETDGALHVEAALRAETLDVSLRVLDNEYRRVTFAKVAVDRSLLPGVRADAGFPPGKRFRDCPGCPEMVVVPEGSFMMGSPESEAGRYDNEELHEVTIARPFAVGVYEVTFGEWDACVSDGGCGGYRPDDEGWGRDRRPVTNVSWHDARAYVRWLSGETGEAYRLLSEAEWEYVARAGTTGPYHFGSSLSPSQANYDHSGHGKTVPVGSYPANAFGLHDVHGNVWEWVEDCWNDSYRGAPSDGSAWESGDCSSRVLRGGAWYYPPSYLRSAYRVGVTTGLRNNYYGFRVARTLTP